MKIISKIAFCTIALGLIASTTQAEEPVYAGHNVLKPSINSFYSTIDTFNSLEDPSLQPYMPGIWGM